MAKKEEKVQIEWDIETWKRICPETFIQLVENKDRYLILYGSRGCFHYNQLVKLEEGTSKPIKDIKIGEKVISFNVTTKKDEIKRVINTFRYDISEEVIKVTLNNGKEIIATKDHKFFFGGSWLSLEKIVSLYYGRNMVNNTKLSALSSKQFGTSKNIQLEEHWADKNNETSKGQKGLFENEAKEQRWSNADNKSSQDNSTNIYSKSREFGNSKSQEFSEGRQQGREFGMDDTSEQFTGCIQQGKIFHTKRNSSGKFNTEGKSSIGDNTEIQTKSIYKENACERILCEGGLYKEHIDGQELELADIKEIEYSSTIKEVFDIEVEDNHNFYLDCGKSVLVHNSGKSVFAARLLIYRALFSAPNTFRCALIKGTLESIRDSSFHTLITSIQDLGLESFFNWTYTPLQITCENGNSFICRGLDNPERLKSTELTCVWHEEDIPNATEEQFTTLTTSLRSIKADYIQEIITINPEVNTGDFEDNWFWKRFFERNKDEKSFRNSFDVKINGEIKKQYYTVHHSTYLDNPFLDVEYHIQMLTLKEKNPYYYGVYALGEWGHKDNNNAFYKSFNRAEHTSSDIKYDPDRVLHLSVDFNVNPHMTGLVFQNIDNKIYLVNEILAKYPNNNTEGLCKEFKKIYQNHQSGLFIYGDSTGKQQETAQKAGVNNFTILMSELKQYQPIMRIPSKNASVKMRGNFINKIFSDKYQDLELQISDKCTSTINDLIFVKETPDGGKAKIMHTVNGVKQEKVGHCCFIGSTLVMTQRGNVPISGLTTSDLALTRSGYKRITHIHKNGKKKVNKYVFDDNIELIATPQHKIYTLEIGFEKIGLLTHEYTFCLLDNTSYKDKMFEIECYLIKDSIQEVYDISVEDVHEYFANGILVSNSDALDYYITEAFKKNYQFYLSGGNKNEWLLRHQDPNKKFQW